MRTLAEMKSRFLTGFNEQQSELLAEFVVETYGELATSRDMAELREVVAELAASEKRLAFAQERTEARVEELAVAQKETQAELQKLAASHDRLAASHDKLAASHDRLTASHDKLAASHDRLATSHDNLAASHERLNASHERLNASHERLAASHEQTQSDVHELTRISKEVLWSLGDLKKQVGGLSNSVGQGLEAYAMQRIPRILEHRFGFVTESAAPESIGGDGQEYPFDIVYRGTCDGHRVVVLCEVKTNITIAEVEDFLSIATRVKPYIDAVDVRTLFFGYRAGHRAQQLIADNRSMLAFPRGLVVS